MSLSLSLPPGRRLGFAGGGSCGDVGSGGKVGSSVAVVSNFVEVGRGASDIGE